MSLSCLKSLSVNETSYSFNNTCSFHWQPITVLIESVFKKQVFFVLFFTVVFFFLEKCFLVLFFIKMFFFYNDGKNYCLYCNLLQFPFSSNFFCLTLLSTLIHIYIMITLVIFYHYYNIKCGKGGLKVTNICWGGEI